MTTKQKGGHSWLHPKLVVKSTGKYGNGVFAGEDIKKGTVIHVLSGKTMTTKDFLRMVNSGKEDIDDPLQVGRRTYIDLDKLSDSFNHNCDPSSGIRKRSEMFALRDIRKGEEITFDYSSTLAPTRWRMKCSCGSPKCRGIISDVSSIPKKQLDYYIKNGAIQRYMKKILNNVMTGKYIIPKYEIALLDALERTDNLC